MPSLDCKFAVVDIKKGRGDMRRRIESYDGFIKIPIVIHGFITAIHSGDDGISQEFAVDVTSCDEIVAVTEIA